MRRAKRKKTWSRKKVHQLTADGVVEVDGERYLIRTEVNKRYGWGRGRLKALAPRVRFFLARVRFPDGRRHPRVWVYSEADCESVFRAEPNREPPTPEEWRRIREVTPTERMQLYDAICLAPNIPEESLMKLDIEDVELEDGTAKITYRSRNGEKPRTEKLRSAFRRRLAQVIGNRCLGPVFSHEGRRFNHESLRQFWKQDCSAAGVSPHLPRRLAERYQFDVPNEKSGFTIREIADAAGVSYGTACRACNAKHGHLSLGKNQDGSYRHIRKLEATSFDSNGNVQPLYSKRDAKKFISSFHNESIPPDGHLFMDEDTAHDYGWDIDYLRWLYYSGQVDGKDCVRLLRAGGGQTDHLIETTALNQEQLDQHQENLRQLLSARDDAFLRTEFAAAVGCDPGMVWTCIRDRWWPELQRPLDIPYGDSGRPKLQKTVVTWKRSENLTQRDRILIPKREATLTNAVNAVWVRLREVAKDLRVALLQLQRGCRAGRIARTGTILSFATCRRFFDRPDGNYHFRLHAAVVAEMADLMFRPEIAEKYRDRLNQSFEFDGDTKAAEQLAKQALAHWQPDEQPPEPQQPPVLKKPDAKPAAGPAESGEGEQGGQTAEAIENEAREAELNQRNEPLTPPRDDTAYVDMSDLDWEKHFKSSGACSRFLDEHSDEIKTFKPSPRRRKVHLGQWYAYWKRHDAAKSEDGDEALQERRAMMEQLTRPL